MHIPSQIEYMLKKLHDNGYKAHLVGGCVRDFLLGRTPDDYDITTSALPNETMSVFESDNSTHRLILPSLQSFLRWFFFVLLP